MENGHGWKEASCNVAGVGTGAGSVSRLAAESDHRRPNPRVTLDFGRQASKRQGVCRTASALGLDYYSLKKRLEAADGRQRANELAFVELPASLAVGKQCTFELDDGAGATLRVQLVGYDAADVAALSCSLWNAE